MSGKTVIPKLCSVGGVNAYSRYLTHVHANGNDAMYNITPIEGTSTSEKQRLRAVASGPAGPALAGPLFVQETYFLKIEVGQFAHTSRLRGV